MRVLFIGGTGVISAACADLAVRRGVELYLLNRGKSKILRPVRGARQIQADARDERQVREAIGDMEFDAVVNWIAFEPAHIQQDIQVFKDRMGQYIFISSASAYQTPPEKLPVTEDTPLENPFWEYSRSKIECEQALAYADAERHFPYTIVRPSHTYDRTLIPLPGGYTTLHRIRHRMPVIIHGDGSSVWTLTHANDFAVGLVGLLGKAESIGRAFHITSDELLTWNMIFGCMASALGRQMNPVYMPSHVIDRYDKRWGESLLGDKAHSMIFDNSRIRSLVPDFDPKIRFTQGAEEIVRYFEEHPDRQVVDMKHMQLMDRIIRDCHRFDE